LDRAKALAALPSIDTAPDGREAARATGTDGESVSDDDEPSACSVLSSRHCPGMPSGALLGKQGNCIFFFMSRKIFRKFGLR
jgi:hypothetical protein